MPRGLRGTATLPTIVALTVSTKCTSFDVSLDTTTRRPSGGLGLGADLETLNNLTLGHVHDRERRVVLINDIKPTVPVNRDSFRIDAGWQCVDHLQSFCIDHAHVVAIAAGDERAAAIVTHGDAARTLADG